MSASKKTSPWVYVGCGCAVIAVGIVTLIAAVGFAGWREIKELETTLNDPVARDAKVRAMLGTDALPAGLHGQLYLHLPWVLDMAMISDATPEPLEDGGDPTHFRRNNLIYVDMRNFGGRRDRFRDRLGEGGDATLTLEDVDINLGFDSGDVIGKGEADVGTFTYVYQVVAGESEGRGLDRPGVAAVGDLRCADDDGRFRVLIWFRADEDQPEEDDASNLLPGAELGSPRESSDIEALLRGLDPCAEES